MFALYRRGPLLNQWMPSKDFRSVNETGLYVASFCVEKNRITEVE